MSLASSTIAAPPAGRSSPKLSGSAKALNQKTIIRGILRSDGSPQYLSRVQTVLSVPPQTARNRRRT